MAWPWNVRSISYSPVPSFIHSLKLQIHKHRIHLSLRNEDKTFIRMHRRFVDWWLLKYYFAREQAILPGPRSWRHWLFILPALNVHLNNSILWFPCLTACSTPRPQLIVVFLLDFNCTEAHERCMMMQKKKKRNTKFRQNETDSRYKITACTVVGRNLCQDTLKVNSRLIAREHYKPFKSPPTKSRRTKAGST